MSAEVKALDNSIGEAWRRAHLAPLWESPTAHKAPTGPQPSHMWAWSVVRPLVQMAMDNTSPAAVERRVLSLTNPRPRSAEDEATQGTLSVAIQSLLPGESARPHRHSMNALRFVLEGSGAETVVNGKHCPMEFGDLVLTPAWCWHEHRHAGTGPMIWLDALDVPLHLYLGTAEFEPGPIKIPPETIPDSAFAVANILPDTVQFGGNYSPVFRYPYLDARRAVQAAPKGPDGTGRVRYSNPVNGGPAMALLDSTLVQVDKGAESTPLRSNSNMVCCVVEGSGESRLGDQVIQWEARDIFTLPPGNWVSHSSKTDISRLFVVSDRDVLSRLGLLREEVGNTRN